VSVESQSSAGVKYIIWGVLGIIAILVAVKQLGFTPTKITTPGVSVELSDKGGLAPTTPASGDSPPAENTAELTARVHELETQLHSGAPQAPVVVGQGAQTGGAVPASTTGNFDPPRNAESITNIAGTWVGPFILNITQIGPSVVVKTTNAYGIILSVGRGTLNGRNLSVAYTNNVMLPGTFSATISADDTEMNVTDYGSGVPQSAVFRRSR
jgi:hypothetical protein